MNYANTNLTSEFRKSFLTVRMFYDLFQNKPDWESPCRFITSVRTSEGTSCSIVTHDTLKFSRRLYGVSTCRVTYVTIVTSGYKLHMY